MNRAPFVLASLLAVAALTPVSSAQDAMQPVEGKALKALVSGSEMRGATNITYSFASDGSYRAQSAFASTGTYKINKEDVCVFVGNGQDRCFVLYKSRDGSYLAVYFRGGAQVGTEKVDIEQAVMPLPGR